MEINLGIAEDKRKEIGQGLGRVLANTYSLYMKTHGFHWNVTGPHFTALHTMFEVHYTELATAVDDIAERIRAIGEFAPASYSQFIELGSIPEETGVPSWQDMVKQLVEAHETIARNCREVQAIADDAGDNSTVSLLDDRTVTHEKTAWMLRSHLA